MAPNCDIPLDYKHQQSESFSFQSVCWAVYAHQRLLYAGLSIHCRSLIASSNNAVCVYQSAKFYRHFFWLAPPLMASSTSLSAIRRSSGRIILPLRPPQIAWAVFSSTRCCCFRQRLLLTPWLLLQLHLVISTRAIWVCISAILRVIKTVLFPC
uniref:Uncharacterized protein n=1 Tax=Candidatus Kentrum sp. TC TaxID=2126339 RepID=A0A450Z903_9GAMM|nr:MAG: hypothetical protein BECKTC1821D_GA0114238_10984 [Candidatus Kentron sp. TC]